MNDIEEIRELERKIAQRDNILRALLPHVKWEEGIEFVGEVRFHCRYCKARIYTTSARYICKHDRDCPYQAACQLLADTPHTGG